MMDVTFDAGTNSHQNDWLSTSTKPNVWPEHTSHPIWQVMRRGKIWLMPLTTASMAHQCPNVIMLALMQCILNLIVHNLPSLKASLKVRHNLWLCDMCTSPCASHWHLPTTPQVQCILLTSSCSWRTCPRSQRHLSSIPGSFSSITFCNMPAWFS